MKTAGLCLAALAVMTGSAMADPEAAEIKFRDVDFDGMMGVKSGLSLQVTFDIRKENLYDELLLDFYVLLEARDKELEGQFFHCRTVHRFLEEQSGYTSAVGLNRNIMECIDPRDGKYAVVATYRGQEVAVENSEESRWWEEKTLGAPVENVLSRASSAPVVRSWEAAE